MNEKTAASESPALGAFHEEEEHIADYTPEERKSLEALYAGTLHEIKEKEIVKGHVARITDKHAIINIGYKSDGLMHLSEFRDLEELKEGDDIEVFIEQKEDAEGNLVLSRRKARLIRTWERVQTAMEEDEIVEGLVLRRVKGGLIVDIYGILAFLPGSQIDIKPVRDFDAYVGKKIEVKVVKINAANDNVVVSHKMLVEKDLEKQKVEILNNLEKGQVLEGVVKNITSFGAFVDLGGIDGLLHITDISWHRIGHPEELLAVGQKVNVLVIGFDEEKKRISLDMKQLSEDPWKQVEKLEERQKVKGKVVNIADYGAFIEIAAGVEGLLHVSEMSWSQHLREVTEFVKLGDEIEVLILSIDIPERKMALSMKQLGEPPWKSQWILERYAKGTQHKGLVRNITPYGVFVELEEGIDGLVHVSDLSWIKKVRHPSDMVKPGDTLEVVVMELDLENMRMSLSHKHTEADPWEKFEEIYARDTVHTCVVLSIGKKIAILELPYGLEGVCLLHNLAKKDNTQAAVGESLDFVVTRFLREEHSIMLSHTHTFKQPKEGVKKRGSMNKAIKAVNEEAERATLGEIESFSSVKKEQEEQEKKAQAEKEDKEDKSSEA